MAGERRYRAAKLAQLAKHSGNCTQMYDDEMMEIALIENLQREDLNPIEIAKAYRNCWIIFHLHRKSLLSGWERADHYIANFLRIFQLPMEIQEEVSRGTSPMGHARALLAVEYPDFKNN